MTLAKVQFEPDCWRSCKKGGKQIVLKPDLFIVTQSGDYEDYWFFEIDMNTETIARVIDKCDRYIHYFRSGIEQKQAIVFPYVVWVVPDAKRKDSVIRHIRQQYQRGPHLFIPILPDELEALVASGVAAYLQSQESGISDMKGVPSNDTSR